MHAAKVLSTAGAAFAVILLASQTASAERVCHRVCDGGVCTERCVERGPTVEFRTEGRGHRRDEWREERRHRRGPGVEFRAPGVDIDVGH
jgi:hypothetical protein